MVLLVDSKLGKVSWLIPGIYPILENGAHNGKDVCGLSCQAMKRHLKEHKVHEEPNWVSLAQNSALSAHTSILKDGSEISMTVKEELMTTSSPKEEGDVLEATYAPNCTTLSNSRLTEDQARTLRGRAGGRVTSPGAGQK
jgi:hypothetical protein